MSKKIIIIAVPRNSHDAYKFEVDARSLFGKVGEVPVLLELEEHR